VHIFVSYARRDHEVVGRIVDRLEAGGHDVWIDTDDIVGSDRWRASVAEAIAGADVVVLMVTPASMRSASVEREITVAAEEKRRIIPVEIEQAEIAVGLQYDLAGIQRTTFVDRSFDDGVADLLAAIADVPTRTARSPASGRRHIPATSTRPGPGTADGRRRGRPRGWRAAAAIPVGVGLVAVAVMLRATAEPSDNSETPAFDSPASTTAPHQPRSTEVALDATVWFAGYSVDATSARYDPEEGTVSIDVVFTNDQYDTADPCALLFEDIALVVDGERIGLRADRCTSLTPGTSTRTTLDATIGASVASIELGDAHIRFGSPEQHHATIPLDGRPPTSEFPVTTAVSGTLTGEVTSFTVEKVEAVPASCSSWSPLAFLPGREDEISIVVSGSATSRSDYPVGYGKARLTLPDGTDLASSSLAGVIHVLDPGVPERDVRACFIVPAPATGEYRFTAAADGGEPFPEPITFTL
jgi:hypothetical protein